MKLNDQNETDSTDAEIITIEADETAALSRLDVFLAAELAETYSRSFIQKLIKSGNITINSEPVKANRSIACGERIEITVPPPKETDIIAENIPIEIIYQDSDIAVINKQPGLVVHPGAGNLTGTLAHALMFHLKDLSQIGGTVRPGIVHRLDKDTSGLMVIAKNDNAHKILSESFSSREVIKKYVAVTSCKPQEDHFFIDAPLGRHPKYGQKMTVTASGRDALTECTLQKIWKTRHGLFSQFDVRIYTGRTHQIRVHLSHKGLPIVGDQTYSKKWDRHKVPFMLLAAYYLEFTHPVSGERLTFTAEFPQHIKEFITRLDKLAALDE